MILFFRIGTWNDPTLGLLLIFGQKHQKKERFFLFFSCFFSLFYWSIRYPGRIGMRSVRNWDNLNGVAAVLQPSVEHTQCNIWTWNISFINYLINNMYLKDILLTWWVPALLKQVRSLTNPKFSTHPQPRMILNSSWTVNLIKKLLCYL